MKKMIVGGREIAFEVVNKDTKIENKKEVLGLEKNIVTESLEPQKEEVGAFDFISQKVNSAFESITNSFGFDDNGKEQAPVTVTKAKVDVVKKVSDLTESMSDKKAIVKLTESLTESPTKPIPHIVTNIDTKKQAVSNIIKNINSSEDINTFTLEASMNEDGINFAKNYYKGINSNKDFYFVVDKPSGSIFKISTDGKKTLMGEVGIGRNIGDRDTSGGRTTGGGSNETQSGWTRINREVNFPIRSASFGSEFNGFEALINGEWKEIPTGIHGTGHEVKGRVSGGCTRLDDCLEKELGPFLTKGTLIYYTSDKSKDKGQLLSSTTLNP